MSVGDMKTSGRTDRERETGGGRTHVKHSQTRGKGMAITTWTKLASDESCTSSECQDFFDKFFLTAEQPDDDYHAHHAVSSASSESELHIPHISTTFGDDLQEETGSLSSWRADWCSTDSFTMHYSRSCTPIDSVPRRVRSPTSRMSKGREPFLARAILAISLGGSRASSAESCTSACSTPSSERTVCSRRGSPVRGLRPDPASCAMADTGRGIKRSFTMIVIGLLCLATATTVPKLTRMDVDMDYSRELFYPDCKLSLSKIDHHPSQWCGSDSAGLERSNLDMVRSAVDKLTSPQSLQASRGHGGPVVGDTNMRLRGGDTPHFSPSASTCDLRRLSTGGMCQGEASNVDKVQRPPESQRSGARRHAPKLSRTVDLH